MTAICHYCAEDGTFRKVVPSDQAKLEVAGWMAVSGHLAVPLLREVRQMQDHVELIFDNVFTNHRCRLLLADLICDADRRPELTEEVRASVNAVCDDLLRAVDLTGAHTRIEDCRSGLYVDRIASGGRLDQWYTSWPRPAWIINGERLDVRDLEDMTFVIRGRQYPSPWRGLLEWLRSELESGSRWLSAVTQGDVTEPNIVVPLCWLDFEHAGRNVLAGDVANLIWYLLGMGGWLVPTYRPVIYARTLRDPRPPVASPTLEHLHVGRRTVELAYSWSLGAGRRAALETVLRRLQGDLGKQIAREGEVMAVLRPFLAMRILGVISLGQMSGRDAMLCCAKLAEIRDPDVTLTELAGSSPATAAP